MRLDPFRVQERRGELVERDVGDRPHDLDKEGQARRQLARSGRSPGLQRDQRPAEAWLAAIRTALLALIRKCRAAARRDPPASMNCQTRSRRSSDNGLPMIHLQSG